jgi:hypothetical protein
MIKKENIEKLDFLMSKLSLKKNKDGGFPRFMNGILTDDEYYIIEEDINKYIQCLSDLKMLYLIYSFNLNVFYDNAVDGLGDNYDIFSE